MAHFDTVVQHSVVFDPSMSITTTEKEIADELIKIAFHKHGLFQKLLLMLELMAIEKCETDTTENIKVELDRFDCPTNLMHIIVKLKDISPKSINSIKLYLMAVAVTSTDRLYNDSKRQQSTTLPPNDLKHILNEAHRMHGKGKGRGRGKGKGGRIMVTGVQNIPNIVHDEYQFVVEE